MAGPGKNSNAIVPDCDGNATYLLPFFHSAADNSAALCMGEMLIDNLIIAEITTLVIGVIYAILIIRGIILIIRANKKR